MAPTVALLVILAITIGFPVYAFRPAAFFVFDKRVPYWLHERLFSHGNAAKKFASFSRTITIVKALPGPESALTTC
jgi:hypothetical protein